MKNQKQMSSAMNQAKDESSAMNKTITSLRGKKRGQALQGNFTKWAETLNHEVESRNMSVIGKFNCKSTIGDSTTLYSPMTKTLSNAEIGGVRQAWNVQCKYSSRGAHIWIGSACPLMAVKILTAADHFKEAVLGVSRAGEEVETWIDTKFAFSHANMWKLTFNRRNIDDKYLGEIFGDLLQCLDMKMQEIDFASGSLDNLTIVDKSIKSYSL